MKYTNLNERYGFLADAISGKPGKPTANHKFVGMLGEYEMEEALARIVEHCNDDLSSPFSYEIFIGHYEMVGFLDLLHHGWLDRSGYKGIFILSKKALRLVEDSALDLPDRGD